jgi:hypothetical protein
MGIAFTSSTDAYIADYGNNRVVWVSANANLYAGNGQASSSGDGGPAALASLNGPFGLVMDEDQNLYISEYLGGRIRKVDYSTHTISNIAGNGSGVSSGDGGPAASAGLVNPAGLAYASGILYVVEYGRSVRQINLSTGIITTLVATSSGQLSTPMWVTVETFPTGLQRILVTDVGRHKILSVDPNTGALANFAGNGDSTFEGDGMLAVNTGIGSGPLSIVDDQNGGLYAADASLNRIRRIDRDTGIIETVAGNGFNQPLTPNTVSLATSAALQTPQFITASSSAGYALFSDSNNKVWLLYLPSSSNGYTSIMASANPASPHAGQSMSLTATVAPNSAMTTPTGSVTFEDANFNVIGTATLSAGSATLSTTAPPTAGPYPIYAVYNGSTTYFTSTSPALLVVVQPPMNPSTTALSSSPNPSVYSQTVTMTATVTPNTATGTVQFLEGSTVLGTAPLSGGTATLATAALATGGHWITAVYGGDAANTGSISAGVAQSVNQASTATTITSSLNPAMFGQSVTFTATVTPGSATGSVQFMQGNTPIGTVALSSGTAVLTTSSLPAGYYSVSAAYSGDTNYLNSFGNVIQSVTKPTSTSLTSDKTSITFGQSVTFTATVSPSTVSGGIQFWNGTVLLGSATLNSGQAKLSTVSLTGGTDSVTAVYSGDITDAPSTSAPRTITVARAKVSINLGVGPNPASLGQMVTITAGLNASGSETGTFTFKDGNAVLAVVPLDPTTDTAVFLTSALSNGNHSITAVYSGDANYLPATSSPTNERVK